VASIVGIDTVVIAQPTNREAFAIFLFGALAIREGTRAAPTSRSTHLSPCVAERTLAEEVREVLIS
jgi:hypothetical protein